MRQVLAALMLVLPVYILPASAAPLDEIPGVIVDQISDFQRNDFAAAFEHASPGIQGLFETPERFGEMVRGGYPMVWRPSRYEMLGLAEGPRGPVQTVLFQDQAGRLWEADYLMQEVDGVWRINGVQLREMPGVGS